MNGSRSEEMRTKEFAGAVRFFVPLDKKMEELRVIPKQMLRSGTSVGANCREASRARSDSEFIAKIEQLPQEADETQNWLELLRDDCGIRSEPLERIWNEADDLLRMFVTISKNTRRKCQG